MKFTVINAVMSNIWAMLAQTLRRTKGQVTKREAPPPEPPTREAEILAEYSTPRLRRNTTDTGEHVRPPPKEAPRHILGAEWDKAKLRRAGTSS